MIIEQTAQQLELAAQILRTGHPWEFKGVGGFIKPLPGTPVLNPVADGNEIRPVLATPPDNRPLHNPDNLTAEQVGVGYRLLLTSEKPNTHVKLQEKWKVDEWVPSGVIYADPLTPESNTYRLPLSVPWPEPVDPYAELKAAHAAGKVIQILNPAINPDWIDALSPSWDSRYQYRIKPEEPAFQLPPPPPGMRWHREDGWKEGDLPSGYRPLVKGEKMKHSTDSFTGTNDHVFETVTGLDGCFPMNPQEAFYRTICPLTFQHAGKMWTWHRPGDPMPCDGEALIHCIMGGDAASKLGTTLIKASCVRWTAVNPESDILGWRYADEKKTVPLGPEDVPPGSVFAVKDRIANTWHGVLGTYATAVELDTQKGTYTYNELASDCWQINRSIPLTGKWSPDAWEPCSKTIPADENLAEPKSR